MVRARKRFGQNFLIDETIINQITGRFSDPSDTIVEIGPGRGALTGNLLNNGAKVIALELDRDLIPVLQHKFKGHDNLTLHQTDALKFDFASLAPQAPLRLVGNLPYNVATPLIFRLLEDLSLIRDMHFMLQWEVVARLAARAGENNYGQLSVIVQNLCETSTLIEVPPASFEPAPKVNSGVIHITPRAQPLIPVQQQKSFTTLVKTAFAQRRKTLRNNLKGLLTESQIEDSGVAPGLRAEVLDINQFAALTTTYVSLPRTTHGADSELQ